MKRPYILVIIGVLLIIAAIILNYMLTRSADDDAPVSSDASSVAPMARPGPTSGDGAPVTGDPSGDAPEIANPSFDVVRVSPEGNTVIAGRAEPGSQVRVRDGETVIGEATADARGEWVILPETPLSAGDRELSVEAEGTDGEIRTADDHVVLLIPEQAAPTPAAEAAPAPAETADEPAAAPAAPEQQSVIALLVPNDGDGPTTVMQGPGAVENPANDARIDAATDAAPQPRLSIDVVDYDDQGRVAMSGKTDAGHDVRVYLDNRFVGEAPGSDDGAWALTIGEPVEPGQYTLRADQLDPDGKVVARVEIPFERADTSRILEPGARYVVQPGNSLWRIARRTYGDGLQYWVIYNQNRGQIRDPDLIYPGQIFALPETGETPQ
ncbi:Ig-like domain-containing protein [Thalassospira sp.]|uniref:Ig-like domain-containing protein n=1 Tax=Thalassospira sp. TaxID=1912094 RepID=UPI002735168A|nr:Ig-like domain-containing protein [Thalassospira sp.]MDP2698682.1 Ig-like domain-containing protein [Thalassospira sp.]